MLGDPDGKVDAEDSLCATLEEGEAEAKNVRSALEHRRQFAVEDPRLRGDHEKTVVGEYDLLIASFAELIGVMVDLRWAVLEHDADIEAPTGQPFDSAEELIADLKR